VSKKARDHWPHVNVVGGRFVVSLIVNDLGLPTAFPRESFLLGDGKALPDLHVQRYDAAVFAQGQPGLGQGRSLLVAEMLLPYVGGYHVLGARSAVLATLRKYLPFVDQHLVLVDSPHDGLPADLIDHKQDGSRDHRTLERAFIKGATPGAEPMSPRLWVQTGSYLSLAGEPLRGPIPGSYLVGPTVLPSLGQEGEALAAWGVAKIITKKDRARQKMRRQMWTKIETG
jgi:hypothetical protein